MTRKEKKTIFYILQCYIIVLEWNMHKFFNITRKYKIFDLLEFLLHIYDLKWIHKIVISRTNNYFQMLKNRKLLFKWIKFYDTFNHSISCHYAHLRFKLNRSCDWLLLSFRYCWNIWINELYILDINECMIFNTKGFH